MSPKRNTLIQLGSITTSIAGIIQGQMATAAFPLLICLVLNLFDKHRVEKASERNNESPTLALDELRKHSDLIDKRIGDSSREPIAVDRDSFLQPIAQSFSLQIREIK